MGEQLKSENGAIFNNKEKISNVLKTAVKEKLASMDCLIDDDLPNYIMIMMANRKTKKEMTEALTLFLNDRTEEFTTWLYQMLDNIRKRREKQKESDDKPEKAKENNNEKDEVKGHDELELGVGPQDDLDRELIGDEKSDKKSDKKQRDDKRPDRKKSSDKKDDNKNRAKGKSMEPKKQLDKKVKSSREKRENDKVE